MEAGQDLNNNNNNNNNNNTNNNSEEQGQGQIRNRSRSLITTVVVNNMRDGSHMENGCDSPSSSDQQNRHYRAADSPAPHPSMMNPHHHNHSHAPPTRQVSSISLPKAKSDIFGACSNMVNSIVGAGIIGIPYAIGQSGFLVGVVLLILVSWMTDKSLRIIVETASFHPKLANLGVLTYEDLMRIPFGKTGANFILCAMFVMAYGAMVAYLLIIKDTVPTVLGLTEPSSDGSAGTSGTFLQRELTMVVTSLLIVVPLSMMRDMASLAFTSLLSVTADAVLVVFIVLFSPIPSRMRESGGLMNVLQSNLFNSKLFIGLGVLSTAMACQHSAFIVSGSLDNRTADRWAIVTCRSLTLAFLMCTALGVSGYLGFLEDTQGDILNNFPAQSLVANAGRALLAFTMFLTYPMESFVARHVLVILFYNGDMDNESVGPNGEVIPERKWCCCLGRRERLTLIIYIMTLIPALIVDDLGPVLSLTGSIGASAISYIGPGLVYFGINGEDFLIYTVRKLQGKGKKTGDATVNGSIELPVVGDSRAQMQTAQQAHLAGDAPAPSDMTGLHKPLWYYLMGYPLWTAIARSGANGTRQFLQTLERETGGEPLRPATHNVIGPRKRDYYISMFFIFFGILAGVVGVASNIYVQVHHIYYAPK